MNKLEFEEYISAFVDKQYTGLTDRDIFFLRKALEQYPELWEKYLLDLATKLCLSEHVKPLKCPSATADAIRGVLYHVYKTRQASIKRRKNHAIHDAE